jgi:hypothetical protein
VARVELLCQQRQGQQLSLRALRELHQQFADRAMLRELMDRAAAAVAMEETVEGLSADGANLLAWDWTGRYASAAEARAVSDAEAARMGLGAADLEALRAVPPPPPCDTAILSAEQLGHVLGWLERPEPPRLELIYRASRDGWADTDFHRMCAGKPSTVSVIRSVGGYIFGGYLQPAWKPRAQGHLEQETKGIAPASAFVFALHTHSGLGPTKIPYTGRSWAAENCDGCCMIFGDGEHIVVASNANANDNSYTCFGGDAYACPAGQDGQTFLTGAYSFRAAEVEVFQVGQ